MNIYVGNLTYQVSPEDVEKVFSAFGQVTSVKLVKDRETGRPKGFGFVEMPNDGEARKAIEALNEKDLQGRNMRVNEARPR